MSDQNIIIPFQKGKIKQDLRKHLDGPKLLGRLGTALAGLDKIDAELSDSIRVHTQYEHDDNGEICGEKEYTSTVFDKETIAVFHARQAGYKMQIDTVLRMLNKVMPDLRAVEVTDNLKDAKTAALEAFAIAARGE